MHPVDGRLDKNSWAVIILKAWLPYPQVSGNAGEKSDDFIFAHL